MRFPTCSTFFFSQKNCTFNSDNNNNNNNNNNNDNDNDNDNNNNNEDELDAGFNIEITMEINKEGSVL